MNDASSNEPVLYFAYADNLHPQEIFTRLKQVEKVAVAKLPNYVLGFFGQSERWDGGEPSAVREPGADLWGVVYRLSIAAFDRLDAWQEVKLDGSGRYFHCPAEVTGEDGTPYSAAMYRLTSTRDQGKPSAEHLAYLAEGAQQQGLPDIYVESLMGIPSLKAGYEVPVITPRDGFLVSLPLNASCAC